MQKRIYRKKLTALLDNLKYNILRYSEIEEKAFQMLSDFLINY